MLLLSGGLAAVVMACGLIALAVPASVGTAILGPTWAPAHRVLLAVAVSFAAFGASIGGLVGLRALAAAKLSLRARLVSGPSAVVPAIAGAAVAGTQGAAWGYAIGTCIGAVAWWWFFREGLRGASRGTETEGVVPTTLAPAAGVVGED
jgi:hypothetical protein